MMKTFKPELLASRKAVRTSDLTARLALLATVLAVFVPLSPKMPQVNLDPSWAYGVNQAVAQGLIFGRDLIFTFGPYASIYSTFYHPATDGLMVWGSLYLALSFWFGLMIVSKDRRWGWPAVFAILLAGLSYARDSLLFSLPLLAGLATLKLLEQINKSARIGKPCFFYIALLYAPLGLLPLIKGSMLMLCIPIPCAASLLFLHQRQKIMALIVLLSPLLSMFCFWLLTGYHAAGLVTYFKGMVPIISGYTEAMSISGGPGRLRRWYSWFEVAAFLLMFVIFIRFLVKQEQALTAPKLFLVAIYFLYLFASFKAGFVRHDGHALIASSSLLIGALLLLCFYDSKNAFNVLKGALLVWACFDFHYIKTTPPLFIRHFVSTYQAAWYGLGERVAPHGGGLIARYGNTLKAIRAEFPIPLLQGTTDVYSFGQTQLLASGNKWAPRPILQSYSAYTPALAEANKKHLTGGNAPDNIIFRVEPIDNRMPSLEDGVSWPVLFSCYAPQGIENDYLRLRRKSKCDQSEAPIKKTRERHILGERVYLPVSKHSLFAQIEIRPNLIGRIADILFKRNELQITVNLANGQQKKYRLVPGLAASGFLVTPLVMNTGDFALMYGKPGNWSDKRVKSLIIGAVDGLPLFWHKDYTITFSELE